MAERKHLAPIGRPRAHLAAPAPPKGKPRRSLRASDEATDAARWRALMDCQVLKVEIDRGVGPHNEPIDLTKMKFYLKIEAVSPLGVSENYFGVPLLTRFADMLILQRKRT